MNRKYARLPIELLEKLAEKNPELSSYIPQAKSKTRKPVRISRQQINIMLRQLNESGVALIRTSARRPTVARVTLPRFYEVELKYPMNHPDHPIHKKTAVTVPQA